MSLQRAFLVGFVALFATPILAQQPIPVLDDDDEATLHERIKVVERRLLVDVLEALATRGVIWTEGKATIG